MLDLYGVYVNYSMLEIKDEKETANLRIKKNKQAKYTHKIFVTYTINNKHKSLVTTLDQCA